MHATNVVPLILVSIQKRHRLNGTSHSLWEIRREACETSRRLWGPYQQGLRLDSPDGHT